MAATVEGPDPVRTADRGQAPSGPDLWPPVRALSTRPGLRRRHSQSARAAGCPAADGTLGSGHAAHRGAGSGSGRHALAAASPDSSKLDTNAPSGALRTPSGSVRLPVTWGRTSDGRSRTKKNGCEAAPLEALLRLAVQYGQPTLHGTVALVQGQTGCLRRRPSRTGCRIGSKITTERQVSA